MTIITNQAKLNGTTARRDAVTIISAGLEAIDTKNAIEASVSINDNILRIGTHSFTLSSYQHIYIIGFGKVSCIAAYTLETIFKGRVKEGAVIGIKEKVCGVIDTYAGTHPLPSGINFTATRHIEEIAHKATENDLVLVVVSGGGSALLCSSEGECVQNTKLFTEFLPTGGTIDELNLVRRHILSLKGGGLAKALYPATVVGLVFSDIPGDNLSDVASGPTYYDSSTILDAEAIISKYKLGSYQLVETPKDEKYFARVTNISLVTNLTALSAMSNAAAALGYTPRILDSALYADLDTLRNIVSSHTEQGTVILIGGETKLKIPDGTVGKGGRNDTVALALTHTLGTQQLFASVASDGRDNSEAAGALIDYVLLEEAKACSLDSTHYLDTFNASPYFEQLGGHILTGPLESNVSDLMLLMNQRTVPETVIDSVSVVPSKDSRGVDTITVTVSAGGKTQSFAVPSGASTGSREVMVVPVAQAISCIRDEIAPQLCGQPVCSQGEIDATLHRIDGTENFSRIGGNTALGISVAVLKAAAQIQNIPTHEYVAELFSYRWQAARPRLFVNLINGGKHASRGSAIQEHQIIPETDNVIEALQAVRQINLELRQILFSTYGHGAVSVGDEGGYVIPNPDPLASLGHLQQAITAVAAPFWVAIGIDAAAGSFFSDGVYTVAGKKYSATELTAWYESITTMIPSLTFIEDPYAEDDFESFALLRKHLPHLTIIGDDLTTTNSNSLHKAIECDSISSLIIKPNQIGTITDTLATMAVAYEHGVTCIVSHRSGETMDDFIADLAIGTRAYGFKAGSPTAIHRSVKYDRLRAIIKNN